MAKKKNMLVRAITRYIVGGLAAALLLAVFYLAVILGQPQDNDDTVVRADPHQPLLAASPAVNITDEGQLGLLAEAFPAALLRPMSGSGLDFVSGTSYDTAYENGFARRVALIYQTADGQTMTVESIYPARALTLLPKGAYHLASIAGQSLAGMASVRMEDGSTIRLHAQSETGLYCLTVPMMDSSDLAALTRSLQLMVQAK